MMNQADPTTPKPVAPVVETSPYEAEIHRRQVTLRIVRIGFAVLFAVVTGLSLIGGPLAPDAFQYWQYTLVAAIVVAGVVVTIDLMTPEKKISAVVSVVVGLLAAMLAAAALGFIIDLLAATYGDINVDEPQPLLNIIKILMGTGLAYLAISTVFQTQDDIRLVIPYVEFAKQIRGQRPLILDTSALIDGRLIGLTETGLVQAPLIIPRFVLAEMQRLSDSDDKAKRARGRRGLDMVSKLQRSARADVTIDETEIAGHAVDAMLVELARPMSGVIVTTDSGLSRVAGIEGVGVVNLHDVASAMRPSVIPGERLRVKLIKPGEQPGQAVGYLEDGTMIVAEDGGPHVGEEIDLFVSTSLQTSAGRLIFARTTAEVAHHHTPSHHTPSQSAPAPTPEHQSRDEEHQGPGQADSAPDQDGSSGSASTGEGSPGEASSGEGGPHVVRRVGRNPRR
ncbi:MAG: hypothetical protein ACI89L_001982 [Phycisphaerales bacterium]|jgi:uncharacterized protein YacL